MSQEPLVSKRLINDDYRAHKYFLKILKRILKKCILVIIHVRLYVCSVNNLSTVYEVIVES